MLTRCNVSNPLQLWEKYKEHLSEDILLKARCENPTLQIELSSDILNNVLILLEDICLSMSGRGLMQCGLPSPKRSNNTFISNEVLRQFSYNVDDLKAHIVANEPLLIADQREAYNKVMSMIRKGHGCIYFLDAPGGTGKTFVINLLLATVRHEKKIAVAVASSGIASTLLEGGRTAHSAFKLPLNLNHEEFPVCNISKGSGQAKVLQECSLIVWDECTMSHKRALEALNRTLQDLRSNDLIMGGSVVLLAGDFRQTLPVIPMSTPADELDACLKASIILEHVNRISLTTNMRVHLQQDAASEMFSRQLLQLGDGNMPAERDSGRIALPGEFCIVLKTAEELPMKVFPNIEQNYQNHAWLCERAILAPKNNTVNQMNITIQNLIPGDTITYKSIDTVIDPSQAVLYPTEFLNSLEPPGMPPHNLRLKVGSSIMLLRNLDPPKLCNGTRLSIRKLFTNVIEATILTGCAKGEDVFLPRIPLVPTDIEFEFKRLQFPIRLAFAMSINKAQGQSLSVAGINLQEPCFSHGQLYVACSRVGNPQNLFIYAPDGKTKNIVYKKAIE